MVEGLTFLSQRPREACSMTVASIMIKSRIGHSQHRPRLPCDASSSCNQSVRFDPLPRAFSHEGRGRIVLQSEAGLGSRFMIRIQEPMSNDGVVQTERVMTGTA